MKIKLKPGAAMRVAIAKDVLKALDAERFIATHGVYVRARDLLDARDEKPLSFVTKDTIKRCYVCMKGALFVSAVDRCNSLRVKDMFRHIELDLGS